MNGSNPVSGGSAQQALDNSRKDDMSRCPWPKDDSLMIEYHDLEWGVPLHDDRKLFEFMVLDTFQAGLSWEIVLRKREAFRKAFTGFDPQRVARFGERGLLRLLSDSGII